METTMGSEWSSRKFIKRGWQLFKQHWKPWLLAGVLYAVLQIVSGLTAYTPEERLLTSNELAQSFNSNSIGALQLAFQTGALEALEGTENAVALDTEVIIQEQSGNPFLSTISAIIITVLSLVLSVWVSYMALNHVRGGSEGLLEQKEKATLKTYVRYILMSIVVGIAVFFGYLLLIIPGVILTLMWSQYYYRILEGDKAFESLSNSRAMTSGYKWNLFKLYVLIMLVSLLGFLAFVIGLLVAVPVIMLATASAYQFLLERSQLSSVGIHEKDMEGNEIIEVEEIEEGDTTNK